MMARLWVAGIAAVTCGMPLSAQVTTVEGQVFEAGNSAPLVGARVSFVRLEAPDASHARVGTTDESGRYRFQDVPAGRYSISIARLGYKPVTVEIDVRRTAPVRVTFGMVVNPVYLEPVEVTTAEGRASPVEAEEPPPARSRRRDRIDRREIDERGGSLQTAYDVVRRLRPNWLSRRGPVTVQGTQGVLVYVDNLRRGDIDVLRQISASSIVEIWLINAMRATQRWGTGHTGGVIHVLQRP